MSSMIGGYRKGSTTAINQIEIFNPEHVKDIVNLTTRTISEIEHSINDIKDDIIKIDDNDKLLQQSLYLAEGKLDTVTDNINSAKLYIGEIIAANRKELNSMNWFQKIIHFRKVKHLQTYINSLMVVREAFSMITTHH